MLVFDFNYSQLFFANLTLVLINNDFLKHKQANINVKSQRFGIIVTPFYKKT